METTRAVQGAFLAGGEVEVGNDPEVPGAILCPKCQVMKPISEFHRSSFAKNGHAHSCKTCMAAYSRNWTLTKRYGLTQEQYEEKLAAQEGRCAACGASDPGAKHGRFQVDHDHETGRVRDLLCNGCNNALGGVQDSIERLQRLIAYLQRWGQV